MCIRDRILNSSRPSSSRPSPSRAPTYKSDSTRTTRSPCNSLSLQLSLSRRSALPADLQLQQTIFQQTIFSSCNPLPFNNWELSLPLRLPDYVSHSLVKMLSQTKLIVLPLQTKTNRHPNKNQCKIIWLSLFAKQKPFRDYFLWLFSVIIFRDYFFFLPLQQRTMQRNAKSNVVSLWE